ncbi:MAG: HAMP domain-containing histidine kinase [Bacteroidetes bacterium]|nr:HAMP domain-containing histidine kinase [Bacteroidota bacterium]
MNRRKKNLKTGAGSSKHRADSLSKQKNIFNARLKKLQSEFITSTSHQFRTPLSTLQSSVDLLELYIEKENTARQLEIISKIKRSINYLTDTVDRITALYKFGSSKEKLKVKKINLRKFINDILDEVAVNISSTHYVNVNIESGLNTIKCNEFILKQILLNIINNAIKFSPQGGQIQMDIKTEKKFVAFAVRDEGVGIDKADLKNLFQPFFRGKNVSTIPGAGLGLAIVKRLGKIHKARIQCASEVNKGTQFRVSIPR